MKELRYFMKSEVQCGIYKKGAIYTLTNRWPTFDRYYQPDKHDYEIRI